MYDSGNSNKVRAIVWIFKTTLEELVNFFGKPIMNYEPYNNTVALAFKSKNSCVDIIKTRCDYSDISELKKELEILDIKDISNRKLDLEIFFYNLIYAFKLFSLWWVATHSYRS